MRLECNKLNVYLFEENFARNVKRKCGNLFISDAKKAKSGLGRLIL
jgi:hypothetical protein